MIIIETKLISRDNSGANIVKCVKLSKNSNGIGKVGEFVLVTVIKLKSTITKPSVKLKKIYLACIIRQSSNLARFDGSSIKFNENSVILLSVNKNWNRSDWSVIGNRIEGPLLHEFRSPGFSKILSLGPKII